MPYTKQQKMETLGLLAANDGNVRKTSRETGISRKTIEKWLLSDVASMPEIATIKNELQDSRRTLMRDVLESALRRILQIIPDEKDLHKLAGVVKIVQGSEVTASVSDALNQSIASPEIIPTERGTGSAASARGTN